MPRHRPAVWQRLPALAGWTVILALLPWWLGLPSLLAVTAVLLLLQHRLAAEHALWLRRGLRWGLPGVLFAFLRDSAAGALALCMALLGMLAGYTLLAGLEAWLDRDLRRAETTPSSAEWPELAMAPVGPPAEIIELSPAAWEMVAGDSGDPRGGHTTYRGGSHVFSDGTRIDDTGPRACFSPAGQWFAACMPDDQGIVLLDRQCNRLHRLRGWKLAGWYREQPWLLRRPDDIPLPLSGVLGQDVEND